MAFSRCTTIRGTNVTVQTLSTPEKGKSMCQALSQVAPLVRSANTPVEDSIIRTDVIGKVLLKCVNKDKKSEAKTFVLRNIQPHLMTTCDHLSALIRDQLGGDVREKFDVGYFQNNNVVTVRSADDMSELWAIVGDGRSILWCDGLRELKVLPVLNVQGRMVIQIVMMDLGLPRREREREILTQKTRL